MSELELLFRQRGEGTGNKRIFIIEHEYFVNDIG